MRMLSDAAPATARPKLQAKVPSGPEAKAAALAVQLAWLPLRALAGMVKASKLVTTRAVLLMEAERSAEPTWQPNVRVGRVQEK